jgi:response regulator NasT
MDKILLVCSSEKGTKVYSENLKSMGHVHIDTESNGGAARRRLINDNYSMVLIERRIRK